MLKAWVSFLFGTILPRVKSSSSPPYVQLTLASTRLFRGFYSEPQPRVNLVPSMSWLSAAYVPPILKAHAGFGKSA